MSFASDSKIKIPALVKPIADPSIKGVITADAGTTIAEVGYLQAGNQAAIATADGSDAATTQALANATKTKVNAVLTALKTAGIMKADA